MIAREAMLKGQFSSKIAAEFTPPKTWVLQKPLSFSTWLLGDKELALLERVGANVSSHNDEGKITCNEGMKTDLASIDMGRFITMGCGARCCDPRPSLRHTQAV